MGDYGYPHAVPEAPINPPTVTGSDEFLPHEPGVIEADHASILTRCFERMANVAADAELGDVYVNLMDVDLASFADRYLGGKHHRGEQFDAYECEPVRTVHVVAFSKRAA